MNRHTLQGRALEQLDYNLSIAIKRRVSPMIEDISLIPEIVDYVKDLADSEYPGDKYMKDLLCNCSVYNIYCPGSLFQTAIAKSQVGLRDVVKGCMGYNNPEMVNYYLDKSKPFMKAEGKKFNRLVLQVKESFKKYSVLGEDWSLELV